MHAELHGVELRLGRAHQFAKERSNRFEQTIAVFRWRRRDRIRLQENMLNRMSQRLAGGIRLDLKARVKQWNIVGVLAGEKIDGCGELLYLVVNEISYDDVHEVHVRLEHLANAQHVHLVDDIRDSHAKTDVHQLFDGTFVDVARVCGVDGVAVGH